MDNVIIGTAGHIDHGKTTLIRALTGRSTDRLKEEKKRGISIELGFTYFDLPDGRRAGIIDVPGHEKFIKNMLAGVGGMDIVLLVVAADEGIMPQTVEHLNILDLIQVKNGIVVLTKADMVEKEWLEMVTEDVKDSIEGTFLEGAPVIPVSSVTGAGMDELIRTIQEITEELKKKNLDTLYRLNIDRAFSITGFGNIVTGTLISGKLELGQRVWIYPAKVEGRIRNLQVHDRDVGVAYAGQRLAVNIAGVKKEQVNRGDVLAPANALQPSMMLDCRLRLVENTEWSLENRDRVRLHIGTKEILCRVVLLDKEGIVPGQDCLAQLRLEQETVALRGDRFVIRSYSPMETIGGGIVLEPTPPKRKRFDSYALEELKLKETGSLVQVLEKIVGLNSGAFPDVPELMKLAGKRDSELKPLLKDLLNSGTIRSFSGGSGRVYIHKDYYDQLVSKANDILEQFHNKNPLRSGMPVEEFRNRLFGGRKGSFIDDILHTMEGEKHIKVKPHAVSAFNFEIVLSPRHRDIRDYLLKLLEEGGYSPPGMSEIFDSTPFGQDQTIEVLEMLVETGDVKRTDDDCLFLARHYKKAVDIVVDHIKKEGGISLATLRDLLGTSRKYAMALLEEMDRERITRRVGDSRALYK